MQGSRIQHRGQARNAEEVSIKSTTSRAPIASCERAGVEASERGEWARAQRGHLLVLIYGSGELDKNVLEAAGTVMGRSQKANKERREEARQSSTSEVEA